MIIKNLNYYLFRYLSIMAIVLAVMLILDEYKITLTETQIYIIIFVSIVIQELVEYYWYKPKNKLADKMMKCELRKKNGLNYCAKCPEGYQCACLVTNIKGSSK